MGWSTVLVRGKSSLPQFVHIPNLLRSSMPHFRQVASRLLPHLGQARGAWRMSSKPSLNLHWSSEQTANAGIPSFNPDSNATLASVRLCPKIIVARLSKGIGLPAMETGLWWAPQIQTK